MCLHFDRSVEMYYGIFKLARRLDQLQVYSKFYLFATGISVLLTLYRPTRHLASFEDFLHAFIIDLHISFLNITKKDPHSNLRYDILYFLPILSGKNVDYFF